MADNRLDPDINLLGYWGFDESLETDDALDGATNFAAANLVVTSALSVQEGRVGASRDFNGTSSFASVTVARLRLLGAATFISWSKLDSYNSTGSTLRTILSCGGPTSGDNLLYSVSIDVAGRIVYKHTAAAGMVIVRTAAGVYKTGQFYSLVVRRTVNGPNLDIDIFLDNVLIPVADVTVNAVPSALPVPVPLANASSIFSAARSQKESDSAFWDGVLDEVSVHDIARSYQPYLRGSYYRIAIRNATSRLTAPNTVVAVSSADMGSGVRWWCYERDRDLYVVRESPFGVFGPDTRLVTTGGGASTDARNVELIYDAPSDTLLVLFVAGNRIFKLTANQTDIPVATPMPFTADTSGIIKSLDNAEGGAFATGGGQRQTTVEDIIFVTRTPVKVSFGETPDFNTGTGGGQGVSVTQNFVSPPSIDFMTTSAGLGVVIGPANGSVSGYRVYRLIGGGSTLLGTASFVFTGGFYFFLFATPPAYGDAFYAQSLKFGSPVATFTNTVVYLNNEPILENGIWKIGREGSVTDTMNAGTGGSQRQTTVEDITYVNRTPVKLVGEDTPAYNLGTGGGGHGRKINSSGSNRPGSNPIEVE